MLYEVLIWYLKLTLVKKTKQIKTNTNIKSRQNKIKQKCFKTIYFQEIHSNPWNY